MSADKTTPICDPHFHLWDLPNRPNANLGEATLERLPAYLASHYEADMSELPAQLQLVSGVHVETIVGQMEGGAALDPVGETKWVRSELESMPEDLPFGIVAYVHLARDTAKAEQLLQQHNEESGGHLRGVRMILNHHPHNPDLTWPQVESGELVRSDLFREGVDLLESGGWSFDLQCNPHQIMDAAELFRDFPTLRVVVNHLGNLHDGEDEAHEQVWREGMRALAALPNIYVKLSMLWFARDGYHRDAAKEAKVRDLVREVIETFGSGRCMFASNYPVDKVAGVSVPDLYGMFLRWTEDLPQADRSALFHNTAAQAYALTAT